jgi:glycosyltransferase involved in cell wall biosynthesis
MTTPSVSIIVFAFNEAENVGPVLSELRSWLSANEPSAQIVLVDDGSSDGTLAAAKTALEGMHSTCLRHDKNRGIGAALKTGVKACEAPWVTFMPADGQIEPMAIGTLLSAARKNRNVDLVLSTYADRDDGAFRKVLSFSVRALVFAVHGVNLRSDGPYLFRREQFVPEALPPDTFFLNYEFPIRILASGKLAARVVIHCRKRFAGVSKSTGIKRIVGVARDLVDLRVRRFME